MKNKVYNQRPIELPENELKVWCHLAPFGKFKRIQHNQEILQLCDQQAFETLIANFTDETLVDFEHKSEDSWDTTAAGWAQKLRIGDDGLEALIVYTDIGAQAIRNRRLRFLSPVWELDAHGRPITLLSIGLTNKPYFTLRPILNSTGDSRIAPSLSNPRNSESGATNNQDERIHHMDTTQIALALGLPAEASTDDILAAIKATQAATTTLENRVEELENKQLEDEAENVADENEDKIENKDAFKALYVANKDVALQLLATLKPVPEHKPVTNKANAKPPAAFSGGTTAQNKLDIYEAMPEGKDKAAYLRANSREINTLRNKRDNT